MSISLKKVTALTAVAAISGFALVGCGANEPANSNDKQKNFSNDSVDKATPEAAADFINAFNDEIAAGLNPEDFKDTVPPLTLTPTQSEQLMAGAEVEGVTEDELKELADFIYTNYPLGDFIYFPEDANTTERIKVLVNLVFLQSLGTYQDTDAADVTASNITVDKSNNANIRATVADNAVSSLIFVNGEWKFDGVELVKTLNADGTAGFSSTPDVIAPNVPNVGENPSL